MGSEISVDKFIEVLQDLHGKLDDGFQRIYDKIGDVEADAKQRQAYCGSRFADLETKWAAKEAANGVRAKHEEDRQNFWKYIVRGVVLATALGMAGMIWKMTILAHEIMNRGVLK